MGDLINGMTPEEIKQGILCSNGCCDCPYAGYISEDETCSEYVVKDTIALIERLEVERDAALAKVPKWISVEEQSEPPKDGEYWCFGYWIGSGRKHAETAEYLCGEWKIVNNFVLTHWMPKPEPPEEEG